MSGKSNKRSAADSLPKTDPPAVRQDADPASALIREVVLPAEDVGLPPIRDPHHIFVAAFAAIIAFLNETSIRITKKSALADPKILQASLGQLLRLGFNEEEQEMISALMTSMTNLSIRAFTEASEGVPGVMTVDTLKDVCKGLLGKVPSVSLSLKSFMGDLRQLLNDIETRYADKILQSRGSRTLWF